MTEQEAKTKWCPHMTYCANPAQLYESNFAVYDNSMCCASECMAWRWDGVIDGEDRSGYCGLAGKP